MKTNIKEYEKVVLSIDKPLIGLKKGDVGTVVHIHAGGEGYEVEFFDFLGTTLAVECLLAAEVRPVRAREVPSVRSYRPAKAAQPPKTKTH